MLTNISVPLFFAVTGMRLVVDFEEMVDTDLSILLRRRERSMTEEFLDGTEIGAGETQALAARKTSTKARLRPSAATARQACRLVTAGRVPSEAVRPSSCS